MQLAKGPPTILIGHYLTKNMSCFRDFPPKFRVVIHVLIPTFYLFSTKELDLQSILTVFSMARHIKVFSDTRLVFFGRIKKMFCFIRQSLTHLNEDSLVTLKSSL